MTADGKKNCRVCGTDIIPVINFGKMPLANAFLKPQGYAAEYFFDLAAGICGKCFMFQLLEQPAPSKMFHSSYPFYTASSNRMVEHFKKMADGLEPFLRPGSRVLEIGSNDGTLLANFKTRGFDCLGIEPSANVAAKAIEKGIRTLEEFFDHKTALSISRDWGKAALVIAANCLCHIPEPAEVFKGLDVILEKEGVALFEDPYLGDVLEKTAYDQIYDEHVFLFSVISMKSMVERFGFEIFDLEPQWTHGGSMRYWVCRKGAKKISAKVEEWLKKEKAQGLDKIETYERFRAKCELSKQKLVSVLKEYKQKGLRVLGYAATSKSTTVLNYCGIGPGLIEAIVDTTPDKQGKVTPGTHIPVLPHNFFSEKYPDAAVLFAWNHSREIFEKEKEYSRHGGLWIEFIPEVNVRKSYIEFDLPDEVKAYLKGRRILVTGASGYLAGNIIGLLTRSGAKVRCLSRQEKPARISPAVEWYQSEMTDDALQKLISGTDVVIHLAAQTSVRFAEENPKADYAVNVKPVLDLIEAAKKIKKNDLRIIFAGTVTQCGIPEKLPVNEAHPDDPVTVYDQHKLEAEKFLLEAARAGAFQAVSLRLSNVYGPGPAASARDRGILNQMVENARQSRPLTLISECENFLRDYLFVEDAARAFLFAACFAPELNGKYCVTGSGQGVSIREAFETVQKGARDVLNHSIKIQSTVTPLSAIDRRNFVADASFFRSRTGWTPQYSLVQGIERTFKVQA